MNAMNAATRAAIAGVLATALGSAAAVDLVGFSATNFEVPLGETRSLSVLLDGPAPTDILLLLTASSATAIAVAPALLVPQGSSSASLTFVGLETGPASIAASLHATTVFSNFTVTSAVPEMRTVGLFAAGIAALGLWRRRTLR